jgi:hypothetical protein
MCFPFTRHCCCFVAFFGINAIVAAVAIAVVSTDRRGEIYGRTHSLCVPKQQHRPSLRNQLAAAEPLLCSCVLQVIKVSQQGTVSRMSCSVAWRVGIVAPELIPWLLSTCNDSSQPRERTDTTSTWPQHRPARTKSAVSGAPSCQNSRVHSGSASSIGL